MCVECVGFGAAIAGWIGHVYRFHVMSAVRAMIARWRM
jgi:hypothetical protein